MLNERSWPELIVKMIALERALGELYSCYAERFTSFKTFWNTLAVEEAIHASWLETLAARSSDEGIYVNKSRFLGPAIDTMSDCIRRQIAESRGPEFTVVNALSIALSYETSLIEKDFYTVFESDSADLRETFTNLDRANRGHRERIALELERIKGASL